MSMLGRMFGTGRNVHYDQGLQYFDHGLFEQAIESLQYVVLEDDTSDPLTCRLALFYIGESNVSLGIAAMQKRAYGKARDYLAKALDFNPHSADLRLHFGRACQKLCDFDAASAAYQTALRINPRFAKARFYLGLALYETGRTTDGYNKIMDAVELEPAFRTDALVHAIACHAKSDFVTARRCFEKVAEAEVDDVSYYIRMGADLYRRGMYDQAIEVLQKALAVNANYADIHNHLGVVFNAKGLHDEAIQAFTEALKVNPDYVEARTNFALALAAAGRDDEADVQFIKVLELDPENLVAQERRRN